MSKWKNSQIKDFGRVITGYTPSTSNLSLWGGDIPFYSPTDFNDDVFCSKTERTINDDAISNDRVVQENSLMVTCIASIGKIALATKKGITNQQINSILFNDKFDPKYCYYLIKNNINELIKLGGTTAVPIVNKADFEKIYLRHHSDKTEQQHIAKILSTADAVIEKTQAAIAKYKAIKQGMLQDLFTRGIDLQTGKLRPRYEDAPDLYKESKLGWIPREWNEIKLGKCGTFRKGGNIPKYSLSPNGVGCILYGQLYTTYHETVKKVFSKVPSHVTENMNPLKYGSILFAGSGETHEEIGKCVVLLNNEEEIYAGGDVVILDLYDEYFKPFFGYFLNFQPIQAQKSKFGQGSSVIHIYANHLSAIDLVLPPRNEQEKIFKIIEQLNNKLQTEQTYLQKMQSLKKGLMEDLLSGRKRVKVAEELITQNDN
ncbi:MAG TPA: restriction endonuclease subunit S [Niabella sp.]|nr:restriction endonuclease subunit S [Niabella sp.]